MDRLSWQGSLPTHESGQSQDRLVVLIAAAAMAGLLAGAQTMTKLSASSSRAVGRLAPGAKVVQLDGGTHACKGANDCKGQGGCKTGDNGCKGQNSCKGHGGCKTDGSTTAPGMF